MRLGSVVAAVLWMDGPKSFGYEDFDGPADQLLGGIPKYMVRLCIRPGDGSRFVRNEHGIR